VSSYTRVFYRSCLWLIYKVSFISDIEGEEWQFHVQSDFHILL